MCEPQENIPPKDLLLRTCCQMQNKTKQIRYRHIKFVIDHRKIMFANS